MNLIIRLSIFCIRQTRTANNVRGFACVQGCCLVTQLRVFVDRKRCAGVLQRFPLRKPLLEP